MNFEITADNSPYLRARGKIVLNACPGSGKTTAVAYKLTTLIDECEQKYGKYSGIACLSFTNVAKDEIGKKYEEIKGINLGYPNIISTIDSFVNQYITLPFYHMLSVPSRRPSILNTVEFLNDMHLGWFPNIRCQPLKVSYPPSRLKIEIDGTYTWDGNKCNPKVADIAVFERYAKVFKNWQIDNGFINNDDSTYLAFKLLEMYPEIAQYLVERFPYIIIDEAQDTSEIQYKIFDILISAGLSNIEFVGDPYQSLYEFREARPDMFLKRFNDAMQWQAIRFSDCRRSSQNIIDMYSLFRNAAEKTIVSTCKHGTDHQVKVIRYDENDPPSLIEQYQKLIDPGSSNYILVRGGTHLEKFGIKPPSEEPWKNSLAKTLINAQHHYDQGNTKSSIDELRVFFVEISFSVSDYNIKKEEIKKLKDDINFNIRLFEFLKGMPKIDDTLKNWTKNITTYVKAHFGIDIDFQLKQKGAVFYALNLKELLFPEITTPFPISTIHKIKGMTFTTILLVLSYNSSGQNISLTDFVRPANLPSEKQRMLYVALSRPEVSCFIAVPNVISEKQIIAQLGNRIEFIN